MAGGKLWTAEEEAYLREMVPLIGWAAAARNLGRSQEACEIHNQVARLGIRLHHPERLYLSVVAELLGVYGPDVRRWVRLGYLQAVAEPRASRGNPPRYVTGEALLRFLQTHPEAYEAVRIPALWRGQPNRYRCHARPFPWLTRQQAARRLGIHEDHLRHWVRRGVARGLRTQSRPREIFFDPAEIRALAQRMHTSPRGRRRLLEPGDPRLKQRRAA